MGASPWVRRRLPLASLLSLRLGNAILEIASLRLRGALCGARWLSRMSQNGKLPTLPGNVRTWCGR